MDFLSIIWLAVGLAMDCFAVSVVQGLQQQRWNNKALLMAGVFGFFHFAMPLIGYTAGRLFVEVIHRYAPWVALVLLSLLGIKMVGESFHHGQEEDEKVNWTFTGILLLAFATSIDVLATGIVFVSYPDRLLTAVSTIGMITAAFSLAGYLIGIYVGKLKFNPELLGGIVLILLGVKIFIEGICS